jgi:hypothetical protein
MAGSATTWVERIFDALVNRCRSGNLVLSGNAPACAMLTLTSTAKRSDYYKLFTSARFGTMLQCASQSLRAFHQLSDDTY